MKYNKLWKDSPLPQSTAAFNITWRTAELDWAQWSPQ